MALTRIPLGAISSVTPRPMPVSEPVTSARWPSILQVSAMSLISLLFQHVAQICEAVRQCDTWISLALILKQHVTIIILAPQLLHDRRYVDHAAIEARASIALPAHGSQIAGRAFPSG